MNKSQRLLHIINEDGLVNVKSVIDKILEKIKVMAHRHDLKITTDMDALKKLLFSRVDHLESGHRKAPVYKDFKFSDLLADVEKKHEAVDGLQLDLFKKDFKETMRGFISLLTTMQKNYSWIDVKELVEPILTIRVERK